MSLLLTTITPCWQRPDALRVWLAAIKAASIPEVQHLLYCVGEQPPSEAGAIPQLEAVTSLAKTSIGHFHNLGAQEATTEWIMKLDVDTLPNVRYFRELLPLLREAKPREWFNGGMIYLNQSASKDLGAIDEARYQNIMANLKVVSAGPLTVPAGTNFICRRQEYLDLGGCDERFRGYGWEDYQQIYMLERYWRGADPLPFSLTMHNVTQRCRDEISRPKAMELWQRNFWLALMHRWHPRQGGAYHSPAGMTENRRVLLEYISARR